MSLAIRPDKVTAILLADGWHEIKRASMEIDSYEYVGPQEDDGSVFVYHGGGASGITAIGFSATGMDDGQEFSGPLTSVIAVRHTTYEKAR